MINKKQMLNLIKSNLKEKKIELEKNKSVKQFPSAVRE
jgi:hypothetical protein